MPVPRPDDFAQIAQDHGQSSLLGDFWLFLKQTRKWWLLPIVALLLLFAFLLIMSSSAAAPFIYTLF
jgi:hypothetical protein